ncbi:MAG: TIGR00341 family protein [Barnesiella sp.]|nr:TIGR00341 family protein [Barnesiella sp.]
MTTRLISRITTYFHDYFSLQSQLVPQADAEAAIREGVSFRGTSIIILIMAILVASLGLNTNSTAVIIGAMLISPLMGPIIGMGLGVGIHDFELIKRALRNLIMAAGFSVIASTLYFLISPVNEGHSELLARTSPTIYDVLIGFIGGGAGIIALGSTNKGQVIPGVAIATALMPPLCTAGYGLATWQLNYFFGAFYLFLINSIYIAFATFIGVKLLRYKGVATDTQRSRRVRRIVYTIAILTMLPSIWLTYRMIKNNDFVMRANNFVSEVCHFPATQVLSQKAENVNGTPTITITLIGRVLPQDSLLIALNSQLPAYGLKGTDIKIVQGDSPAISGQMTSSASDIYQLAQTTITRQQSDIDSLKSIIATEARNAALTTEIAPEIKVLFPQIKDIGMTRTIFSEIQNGRSDTVSLALVEYASPMTAQQRTKLKEYLEARLHLPSVYLIDLGRQPHSSQK